jgi:IS30 family transposase
LDIESGLKEDLTFTEIGKKLGRDRTTKAYEVRYYAIEQCTGYSIYPIMYTSIEKAAREKECETLIFHGK